MSRYLYDKLKEDRSITKVFFDASGGWSLIPSNLHPIEKSSKEVLSTEAEWSAAHEKDTEDIDVTEYLQELEAENAELKEQNAALTKSVEELTAQLAKKKKGGKEETADQQ